MPDINIYQLCGLRVESDLVLVHMPAWPEGMAETEPGLRIRIAPVPPLEDAQEYSPLLQQREDGTCRFCMPDVAAYQVNPDGTEVVIEPFVPRDAPDIDAFLYSTVFSIICFKRNWLPLHAASTVIGGQVVAFCGNSGAGKSTLASRFIAKGIPVLSDDVAVIDIADPKQVLVRTSMPHIKLWSDVMEKTDISSEGLIPVRGRINKYFVPLATEITGKVPLKSIYFLEVAQEAREEKITPLAGVDSFLRINNSIYRRHIGHKLLSETELFRRLSPVATAVRCFTLRRQLNITRADEIVDEIVSREG